MRGREGERVRLHQRLQGLLRVPSAPYTPWWRNAVSFEQLRNLCGEPLPRGLVALVALGDDDDERQAERRCERDVEPRRRSDDATHTVDAHTVDTHTVDAHTVDTAAVRARGGGGDTDDGVIGN
jgi:hypothetical protein